MLDNKEVLKKFEEVMLNLNANTFEEFYNEAETLISEVVDKTGLYREVIYYWLNERVGLKQNDLKKIDDYLDIIKNKKNCVNLLTAIAKGYIYIKFDLDDGFTNGFIENIHKSAKEINETDDEDKRLKGISKRICDNEPMRIRDILFIMSYLHTEEEYDYISKKLMVYRAKQD